MTLPTNSTDWRIYAVVRMRQRRDAEVRRQTLVVERVKQELAQSHPLLACKHDGPTYVLHTFDEEAADGTVLDGGTQRRCVACNRLLEILS